MHESSGSLETSSQVLNELIDACESRPMLNALIPEGNCLPVGLLFQSFKPAKAWCRCPMARLRSCRPVDSSESLMDVRSCSRICVL